MSEDDYVLITRKEYARTLARPWHTGAFWMIIWLVVPTMAVLGTGYSLVTALRIAALCLAASSVAWLMMVLGIIMMVVTADRGNKANLTKIQKVGK